MISPFTSKLYRFLPLSENDDTSIDCPLCLKTIIFAQQNKSRPTKINYITKQGDHDDAREITAV